MRHMAAMGYIVEVAADEYKLTNFTKSLTIPIIGDGYPCMYVSNPSQPRSLPNPTHPNSNNPSPIPHYQNENRPTNHPTPAPASTAASPR